MAQSEEKTRCECICRDCFIGGYCIIQKGEHAEGKCVKECTGLKHYPSPTKESK